MNRPSEFIIIHQDQIREKERTNEKKNNKYTTISDPTPNKTKTKPIEANAIAAAVAVLFRIIFLVVSNIFMHLMC